MQSTRLANWLERYTNWVMRHPWPVLASVVRMSTALRGAGS